MSDFKVETGGFLTEGARIIIKHAEKLTPMSIIGRRVFRFKLRNKLDQVFVSGIETTRDRANRVDQYITFWLFIEICVLLPLTMSFSVSWLAYIAAMVGAWRIFEIVQVVLSTSIFDALNGRQDEKVSSKTRIVVLAGINFTEIMINFGMIYAANINMVSPFGLSPLQGLYLSAMIQFTIGFGDVAPRGFLKAVVIAQGFSTTILVVLFFGRIVASFRAMQGVLDAER